MVSIEEDISSSFEFAYVDKVCVSLQILEAVGFFRIISQIHIQNYNHWIELNYEEFHS